MAAYFAGIDIGSTMTKAVILNNGILASVIGPTGPEHRKMATTVMEEALHNAGIRFSSITYIVSTGYGRINVPYADKQITEISCHAKGVSFLFPGAGTVIDIGGQDSKAIVIDSTGRPTDFVMNDKCAAGSGRFIEVIADTLGLSLEEMGDLSLASENPVKISSICTLWAQQEVVENLAKGAAIADLVAGIHISLAERITGMVRRLRIKDDVVITGGGAKNRGLVHALSRKLNHSVVVPENSLITGALGAALLAGEMVKRSEERGTYLERKERRLEDIKIL
ncbi:MAG TPA: 2-hydroxyglutaryl-CoA dehydratase [Desulfobacteraceae bacterium]|nr:2-hydroxyglutaryl-CoA dehydratase [Desulfobacteraceae bacterium]